MMTRLRRYVRERTAWPVDPDLAPADKRRLGMQAMRLLDDPVLALAFQRIERRLTGNFRNTAPGQTQEREEAYRLGWAVDALKAELRAMLGNAKLIDAEALRKAEADRREALRRERAMTG